MSLSHDKMLSALAEWTIQHRDDVRREASRRDMEVTDFVIHMMDDILSVYTDESDSEIAEGKEVAKEVMWAEVFLARLNDETAWSTGFTQEEVEKGM